MLDKWRESLPGAYIGGLSRNVKWAWVKLFSCFQIYFYLREFVSVWLIFDTQQMPDWSKFVQHKPNHNSGSMSYERKQVIASPNNHTNNFPVNLRFGWFWASTSIRGLHNGWISGCLWHTKLAPRLKWSSLTFHRVDVPRDRLSDRQLARWEAAVWAFPFQMYYLNLPKSVIALSTDSKRHSIHP